MQIILSRYFFSSFNGPNTSFQRDSWKSILLLAYQSLGVVYGDLSISPLYVYKSTFAEDITHSETNEEIFGVLSFVFWTLTLVPLFKYVFIVLRADDNGEGRYRYFSFLLFQWWIYFGFHIYFCYLCFAGGTFALYSSICRHANVSLLPNRQVADEELSTYILESPPEAKNKSTIKSWLEKHKNLHVALLVVVMLGTCMVIGDGVLTPAISGNSPCVLPLYFFPFSFWLMSLIEFLSPNPVFSAVSGLEFSVSKDHRECKLSSLTRMFEVYI